MMDFIEIATALEIMEDSYHKIRTLSQTGFLMFLGNLIDQFGADHNMTSSETCEMLDQLLLVQKEIHAIHGMATPTL